MRSYNDDLVMSCAIGCWIRDIALVVNQRELQYRQAMISAISVGKKDMNTKIPGQVGYNKNADSKLKKQYNQTQAFAWLFKG